MRNFFLLLLLLLTGLAFPGQGKTKPGAFQADAAAYVRTLKKLTDLMVIDVTGPCAAARYYAYANLAAYEVLYQQSHPTQYLPFAGRLREYPDFAGLRPAQPVDAEFAGLYALLRMGEELLPSGHLLAEARKQLIQEAGKKHRVKEQTLLASQAYADSVVARMVKYAAQDGYLKTTGYLRYTPLQESSAWQPTGPGYLEAYEPHWASLRPFLLDSASQFRPLAPVPYDAKEGTPFHTLAKEVYDLTRNLSEEQTLIAGFWDCNPFFLTQMGHVSFGTKKISPGGHWMGITGIASVQKNLSLAETVRWHALVGITMADAFISCWDEKYRSNRIRPETFINEAIDRDWRPLLQTPPFPEYTSGHSVVSTSVALVLTQLAGEDFAYTDTVEIEFGLPSRSFRSFKQAAQEAAISRLYGGIHYRDAIDNGVQQGEQIGRHVLQRLQLNQ